MRILLVTPNYAPDMGPSVPLFTMLCEDLVRLGHQVSVVTAVPHYPSGIVRPEFRGRLVQREERNGVDVTRVWVPSVNRANLGQRLLTFICYQLLATPVGLRRQYDVVLASNPALQTGLPFFVSGALCGKPGIFSIHDVLPDVGVKLGIFKNRLIIQAVECMERFCIDRATYVRVLSEDFARILKAKGVPNSKLVLIYDWLDPELIRPLPRHNEFSARYGLDDSFVVMYAGNIGFSQGLENVVSAAQLLAEHSDIRFVFVGDGAGKESLEETVQSSGLTNTQFIPLQTRDVLPMVLASADVSLVILKRGIGSGSLPSKCFSILPSGRPMIASVDEDSATWNMVRRAECGLCVPPEGPGELAQAVLQLRENIDLREQFGRNGRLYAERHHSRQSAARQFEELLSEALAAAEPSETHRQRMDQYPR